MHFALSTKHFALSTLHFALSTKHFALALGACTLLLTSCQKSLTIIGENGHGDGTIYITVAGAREALDSAEMKDGAFVLKTNKLQAGELYNLRIPPHMQEYIIEPTGKLHLDMAKDCITGTPLTEAANDALMRLDRAESDADCMRILVGTYKEHRNDPAGAAMLYYLSMLGPIDLTMEHYKQAGDEVKNTTLIREASKTWQVMLATAPGKPFVDFDVEFEGKTTSLSDFVGGYAKLTLVDFWASWCGPCKREIPGLIEVYEEFRDQGLQVVGVATWDDPEDSRRTMDEMNISYPQILNAQKIGSDAYGIEGIPEIMLIGADGTILERGLRGPAIREAVVKYLN